VGSGLRYKDVAPLGVPPHISSASLEMRSELLRSEVWVTGSKGSDMVSDSAL
jgi:hypothetical protein